MRPETVSVSVTVEDRMFEARWGGSGTVVCISTPEHRTVRAYWAPGIPGVRAHLELATTGALPASVVVALDAAIYRKRRKSPSGTRQSAAERQVRTGRVPMTTRVPAELRDEVVAIGRKLGVDTSRAIEEALRFWLDARR